MKIERKHSCYSNKEQLNSIKTQIWETLKQRLEDNEFHKILLLSFVTPEELSKKKRRAEARIVNKPIVTTYPKEVLTFLELNTDKEIKHELQRNALKGAEEEVRGYLLERYEELEKTQKRKVLHL